MVDRRAEQADELATWSADGDVGFDAVVDVDEGDVVDDAAGPDPTFMADLGASEPCGGAAVHRSDVEVVAEAHDQKWLTDRMYEFGGTLTGKDKTIFEKRLLAEDPQTLQEIGEQYGISRERVRPTRCSRPTTFMIAPIGSC